MMNLIRSVFRAGVALIAVVSVGMGQVPSSPAADPPRRVKVVAHRAARDQAPEDTIAALEWAIADSAEWVAVDVRTSKDGRHVLIRDADLGRTTDGSGAVADRTLDELKALDAGSKFATRFAGQTIPTLDEFLAASKGRIGLQLDCHHVDPARLVQDVIRAGMERQVVVAGDAGVIRSVRSTSEGDRLDLILQWKPADGLDVLAELKPAAVEVEAADVTPELCRSLQGRGVKVQARTIGADDRPEVWDRLAGAGVDAIRTDLAEEFLAREVLRRVAAASRVKIAHHRGASRYAPENTLPAYEKSIRLGADFVEFDIRTSRDGVPFLLHDGRLDRTTTAKGPIRELDAAGIARLDAGAWFGRGFVGTPVPTLDAFLKTVEGRVDLYVDAKDISPEDLVATLRARGLIERSVVYQNPTYLAKLREVEPRLRRMPPLSEISWLEPLADRLEPYAFDTRWAILSKPLIDRCHARGIKVFSDALGANESVESYRKAILDGIDLIQTDHPIRVLRAVDQVDASGRSAR